METTPAGNDVRAVTYLQPNPVDGSFGVEILTTRIDTGRDGAISETTRTAWHPVNPRDGINWSFERAELLLAVLGYHRPWHHQWELIHTDSPAMPQAWAVALTGIV